jgi:hypothetical protein
VQETSLTVGSPSKDTKWKSISLAGAAIYLTSVVVIFALYWKGQKDDWATGIGFEIGTALIPAIIVLLYYCFKKKQEPSTTRILSVLASWILFG